MVCSPSRYGIGLHPICSKCRELPEGVLQITAQQCPHTAAACQLILWKSVFLLWIGVPSDQLVDPNHPVGRQGETRGADCLRMPLSLGSPQLEQMRWKVEPYMKEKSLSSCWAAEAEKNPGNHLSCTGSWNAVNSTHGQIQLFKTSERKQKDREERNTIQNSCVLTLPVEALQDDLKYSCIRFDLDLPQQESKVRWANQWTQFMAIKHVLMLFRPVIPWLGWQSLKYHFAAWVVSKQWLRAAAEKQMSCSDL